MVGSRLIHVIKYSRVKNVLSSSLCSMIYCKIIISVCNINYYYKSNNNKRGTSVNGLYSVLALTGQKSYHCGMIKFGKMNLD